MSETREIIDVPLDKLRIHPNQPRTPNGKLKEMVESIKEVGLIEPIIVVPYEDKSLKEEGKLYMIVAGHTRVAAFTKLGFKQIPAVIAKGSDMAHEKALLHSIQMLAASNTVRQDFTIIEQAHVMQDMLDLGLTLDQIASTTAVPKKDIEALTESTKKIHAGTVKRFEKDEDLTIFEVQALGEFADDSEATKELLQALEDDRFDHTAARLRKARKIDEARTLVVAELEKQGVPVVAPPSWDDQKIVSLRILGIDPKAHTKCPGHCGWTHADYEGKVTPVFGCTEALKYHGHSSTPKSEHELVERAKARAGRQFKKDMVAPTEVRRTFIKAVLAKSQPLKSQAAFLNFTAATARFHYTELTAEFLGKKNYGQLKSIKGEENNMRLLVAAACAYWDEEVRLVQGPEHFRNRGLDFYLTFLSNNGYKISEHEQQLIDRR